MAGRKPVRVVAVTSGKGGVGKTNISINLAAAWARQGRKPMILDADLGLANVDVLLGLKPEKNLSHLINGEATLDEIIINATSSIKVIPASSGVQQMAELSKAEHAGVIRAFSELDSHDVDVLIVDTAAGIDDSVISFTKAAQEILVVVCDEPASITDAYALIKVLNRDYGVHRFNVIANMAHGKKEGELLFKKLLAVTDKFLDEVVLSFAGSVPYDEYLRKAVQKQKPIVDLYPGSPASKAIIEIVKKADQWPLPSGANGSMQFFVEQLVEHQPYIPGISS